MSSWRFWKTDQLLIRVCVFKQWLSQNPTEKDCIRYVNDTSENRLWGVDFCWYCSVMFKSITEDWVEISWTLYLRADGIIKLLTRDTTEEDWITWDEWTPEAWWGLHIWNIVGIVLMLYFLDIKGSPSIFICIP